MVLKQKDSEEPQIRSLELRLKQSTDIKERARLGKTLAMTRAGAQGEKDSAYHINFRLEDSLNWAVIHDLRIELNGRVAQIDHILINRLLEIYVIESKSFRTKIRYAHGGWERLNLNNYWEGIASPVEQNERHILVLKQLIEAHQLAPTRFALKPNFINIVTVQGSCSIIGKLPANAKVERVDTLVRKVLKEDVSLIGLLKVISQETLRAFATMLVSYHRPTGTRNNAVECREESSPREPLSRQLRPSNSQPPQVPAPPVVVQPSAQNCQTCSRILTDAEFRYCTTHNTRFEGKLLCRSCQAVPNAKVKITIAPRPTVNPSISTRVSNTSQAKGIQTAAAQTYDERMQEIRAKHPRAYEQWTAADDNRLKDFFRSRATIPAIANTLQRQPSAIRARLKKLNLFPTANGTRATSLP